MFKMKKAILIMSGLIIVLMISACSSNSNPEHPFHHVEQTPSNHMHSNQGESSQENNRRGPMRMMGHGHHNHDMPLQHSTGENELNIPPILKSDHLEGNDVYYTIEAQKGQTQIFEGIQTATLGFNSSFLGPVMKLKKGQTVHIKLINSLDEETTFHWHGLIIAGDADGGPHNVIQPG